jgi:hypothetical protein
MFRTARIHKSEQILATARERAGAAEELLSAAHEHRLQALQALLADEKRERAAEAESRSQAHEVTVRAYRKQLAGAYAERDAAKAAARLAKQEAAAKAGEALKGQAEAEARAQQVADELVKLQIALHHSGVLAAMQRLQEGYCLEGEERGQLLAAAAAASGCIKCGSRKLKQHGVKDCRAGEGPLAIGRSRPEG